MNTIGVSAREAQEARALTCGMIACVDDAIGGVLAALDRDGLRDDTVVIFTSDHGDHLGDHRLMLKGAEQYQGIVRVPFIWSDPEASGYPARSQALGSTMDISATILERAKIEPFSGMQGRSLTPALRGAAGQRDSVFIQYDHQHPSPGTDVPPRVHTLINGRYRLSLFHGTGWGELYAATLIRRWPRPWLESASRGVFHVVPGGHTDPVTGTNCHWNVFRVCNTTRMETNAVAPALFDHLRKSGLHHAGLCLRPHSSGGLERACTKFGGEELGAELTPLGTTDFSSYLIKAQAANPDVIIFLQGRRHGQRAQAVGAVRPR